MATREEYNNCMRPFITGSKPKDERRLSFCVGAKICSGKAHSEEEAAQLCAKGLPKWAKKALPKEEHTLSCDQRIGRVHQSIDAMELALKSGDTEELVPVCAQVLSDLKHCRPGEIADLAEVTVGEVRELAGRYYMKGEAVDAKNKLEVLKGLL